jgi:predicted AAA+ superfamily ATPase
MFIERIYQLQKLIKPNKVLVLYGARRVGKTTLLKEFLAKARLKYKFESGDNIRIQQLFVSKDLKNIVEFAEGYDLIVLDEAQQVPEIGTGLKILVDNVKGIYVIATGSSSFDLAGAVGEPLTGRKRTFILYPFSQKELLSLHNKYELKENLEDFLIFGTYPEVVMSKSKKEKVEAIEEIVNSYLLKDILAFDRVKSPKVLLDLLKLLSFQVGNLVSLNELAGQLKIDVKTVDRYLDLLEKAFVIKKVTGYSRNLRKEITSKAKYYFIDNGIRNGIIRNYNSLDYRNDMGCLWENFIVMERIKKHTYSMGVPVSYYFWRTHDGKEIDFVEERGGKLYGHEMKWSNRRTKIPEEWLRTYKNAQIKVINRENYLNYVI